ncbi:MAG TPA: methionine aminotransferase [Saprospiraceae bacterium]|nr:methionine aminotransferase [Saprospiraceae bacterium]
MPLRSKLPDTGTTIFTVMSALAQKHGAINLSQGFPNFDPDPRLRAMVTAAMEASHNQYAPMQGLPELREVLAQKILHLYGCQVSPEHEITITAGGTQAIFTAVGAVIQPGDEALVFDPSYDCYAPSVRVFGGIPKAIPLHGPDFRIDWAFVEKNINAKTRLIFINTPHNPLGRAFTEQDIRSLERIVAAHDLYVVSDEVYEHIIFDGLQHQSMLKSEVLSKKSFAIYSFGKLVHATGWKVGYCVAPAELMMEFRKIHQFNVFAVNRPMQHALAEYLGNAATYSGLSAFFEKKRDYFTEQMSDTGFHFLPCEGSYFVLADYSALSDLDDMTFAQTLTSQGGVATIPLSPFYANPIKGQRIVRFCFAKTDETLAKAAELLKGVQRVE